MLIRMRIQHSVHVRRPARDVSNALASGPARWFPRLDDGSISAVGPQVAGVPLHKRVVVEVGEPIRTSSWAVVPIAWRATFPERLFPAMVGRVEMNALDKDVTKLTVRGAYRPPLGSLGRQLDDAVLGAVARATVKELAEAIAARLEKTIAAGQAHGA